MRTRRRAFRNTFLLALLIALATMAVLPRGRTVQAERAATGRPLALVASSARPPAPVVSGTYVGAGVLLVKLIAGLVSGNPLEYILGGGSGSADWSSVQSQLTGISNEITMVNNDVLASAQALTCTVNDTAYSGELSGTNQGTINLVNKLTKDLATIAADRANNASSSQIQSDVTTFYNDEQNQPVSTIADDLYSAALGSGSPSNTPGAIQNLSTVLTTCHHYFNYDDSAALQNNVIWFEMLQANACAIEVNYVVYGPNVSPSNPPGDPTNDVNACNAYKDALTALPIPNVITDPNEVIDVTTGIPWLLDTSGPSSGMYTNTTSCSGDNCTSCGPWAFVSGSLPGSGADNIGDWMTYCSLPAEGWVPEQPAYNSYLSFVGRSGAPWQVLPYYQDVRTFLNDSLCPGTSGGVASTLVTCLNKWGFGVPSYPPFQIWADSDPYFAGNDPAQSVNGPCNQNTDFPGDYAGCTASFNSYGDVTKYWNSGGIPIANGINPPCFTYGYDTISGYTVHWECGYVDPSASFNDAGAPEAAWFLYEWVGPGAANGAAGAPVSGYWLPTGYVPSTSPAIDAARSGRPAPVSPGVTRTATPTATATPRAVETPTAAPRPTETPTPTPRPAETATSTATPKPEATATPTEPPKPVETPRP